jgi:UDP-N-acetylglucosamine 2-epimerase (non-hydrolysing)
MSEQFFNELVLPRPDVNLEVAEPSYTQQIAATLQKLEPELIQNRPDAVIVLGDVTSTLAAALAAVKLGIRVAHVEAGLRSFDSLMLEEINRVVVDSISDYLFATEPSAVQNLLTEGVPKEKIFLSGNVMIDSVMMFLEAARQRPVLEQLGLRPKEYITMTLHRPTNVDDPERLRGLARMICVLARETAVAFPVHPRTHARIEAAGVRLDGVTVLPPLGYLDFLRLVSESRLVITDSGGLQEETTFLRVPCLTVREQTERPITVEEGSNRVVGVDPDVVLREARAALASPPEMKGPPALWDGNASARVAEVLEAAFRR